MPADAPFTCEVCCGTDFEVVYLAVGPGAPLKTDMLACRQCRLVYRPRMSPSPTTQPRSPDWQRYGILPRAGGPVDS